MRRVVLVGLTYSTLRTVWYLLAHVFPPRYIHVRDNHLNMRYNRPTRCNGNPDIVNGLVTFENKDLKYPNDSRSQLMYRVSDLQLEWNEALSNCSSYQAHRFKSHPGFPADPTPSTPFTDFHRKSIDRIYQVCGILRGQATMDRMNSKMHNLNMSTAFWNDFKMLDETSSPYSARLGSARVHSSHDNRTRYALLLLTVSQYISANTWVFHELLYITVVTLISTEMMRYTEVAWPLT